MVQAIGGSLGQKYVFQFLFSVYHKIANNSATTEAREKIGTVLESL